MFKVPSIVASSTTDFDFIKKLTKYVKLSEIYLFQQQ